MMLDLAINGRFLSQPTTGVQRVAREITREIDGLLGEGRFNGTARLLVRENASADSLSLKNIRVETVPGKTGGHFWEQIALPRVLGDSTLLCLGNTAPVISMLRESKVAVVIHDLSYRLYPEAYLRRYRLVHGLIMPVLLRHANPIITVSETEKAMLGTILPRVWSRIMVAQNGGWRNFPTPPLSPEEMSELPTPGYALYVGSFSQRKNFQGLLATAIRLAQEHGIRFAFVGSVGTILRDTAVDIPADIRDKIMFLGQIEDVAKLAELYRRAACLVFPSFYEASPIPPLEAMRFGCPVIASDIASMRERCGSAAVYCDPASLDSIYDSVLSVMTDPTLAAELASRGHAQEARFSWRQQAIQILDALIGTEHEADIHTLVPQADAAVRVEPVRAAR